MINHTDHPTPDSRCGTDVQRSVSAGCASRIQTVL